MDNYPMSGLRPPAEPVKATPLRNVPGAGYTGSSEANMKDASRPSLMVFQSEPSEEEWENLYSIAPGAIRLTGSAATGKVGPLLGKMNIGESDDAYMFGVALPGVNRDNLKYDVHDNGHVLIEGFTTTGEKTLYRDGMKFQMLTQNMPPPGPFSVSFRLAGPVDPEQLMVSFGIDGLFEGVVKKKGK